MGYAFQRGEEHMALLLGLGFCCLLRTSEMLPLPIITWFFTLSNAASVLSCRGVKHHRATPKSC